MRRRLTGWAPIVAATFFALPSFALDDVPLGADDVPLSKDLMAVIALQGLPCGQVVSAKRRGENDYIASCGDGNRYHVFVNSAGRVVVRKQ